MTDTAKEILSIFYVSSVGFAQGWLFVYLIMMSALGKDFAEDYVYKKFNLRFNAVKEYGDLIFYILLILYFIMYLIFCWNFPIKWKPVLLDHLLSADNNIRAYLPLAQGFFGFLGLTSVLIWLHRRFKNYPDYFERQLDLLDKKERSLPALVEFADYDDFFGIILDRKAKKFRKAWKNKQVAELRNKFDCVESSYHHVPEVVKKYHLDVYQPPVVFFLDKDRSRVSIDDNEVFSGEDLTSPERYASLLQKVLEKFSSEGA